MTKKLKPTLALFKNIKQIIEEAQTQVKQVVNSAMVQAYWHIGKLIVEEEQKGEARAEYGKAQLKELSISLTEEFGKGFSARNLSNMRGFYSAFSISQTLSAKLSWSHYCKLISIENDEARLWYMRESSEQNWSVRALERQIGTLYYERLLSSKDKAPVLAEAKEKTASLKSDPKKYLRDPYILELGKGFAFVERQQRLTTDDGDYFIDLVFYNYHLKCFVLIDLKLNKLSHQDVGQMDMYVRLYEEQKRSTDDNPTIGLILCSENNNTVAKYSVLSESKQLFASKYKTQLPTEAELAAELARGCNLLQEQLAVYTTRENL